MVTEMAICEWCSQEIPKDKKSNLFCNMKCYREWNASFRPKLTCEICKKIYTKSEEIAKISTTCSKECRAIKAGKAAAKIHKGKNDVQWICLNCNIKFNLPAGRSKNRKYCTKKCQLDHKKRTKQKIFCKLCGKEKKIKPYQILTAKYCSKECKDRDLKGKCGVEHPAYKHGFKTYRKRALECFKYTCKCCGKIDRRLHVHHIDGNNKNNVPENWMVLCPKCHRQIHLKKISLPLIL